MRIVRRMLCVFFAGLWAICPMQAASAQQGPLEILVDAGHGGVDGGAVASDGTLEKDLNLQIALKVAAWLRLLGVRVTMTRETDCSIHDESTQTIRQKKISDIKNRLELLEESQADLLLSIHQNMYGQSRYRGTQVFYGGGNAWSKPAARSLQQSVQKLLQPENTRQVKQTTKSIYLLYHATKPAVLVECGFLSNADELGLLKQEDYQRQLSFCIICGILDYQNIKG